MFSVASTYDGGLSNFLINTTQDWSLLTGNRVFGVLQWYHWLIANGTIGKDIGANVKNGNTNGTNVTNQWYYWENPEHTLLVLLVITIDFRPEISTLKKRSSQHFTRTE